jgi:selenocysteine lyase/cysteine desulfurase
MAPQMRSVTVAGQAALVRKENPISISVEDFFTDSEKLRHELATLIHCAQPKRIAIIPSVSYGMANVAHNLRLEPGQEMVVTGGQFPSNVYPWMRLAEQHQARLVSVEAPPIGENRAQQWNQRILEAITPATRLVALGHVHWADGTLFDLKAIRQRTRDVGALLVIDGTQSVGALPFSVEEIQPDALVCAGYKWLLGPYAMGFAYYGPAFDGGVPIEENWINREASEDFRGLVNYRTTYQSGALRYEVGEHSNFILLPMFLEAIRQINRWGEGTIQEYTREISEEAIVSLQQAGFFIEHERGRAHHLFGVGLPKGKDMATVQAQLVEAKIYVSVRGEFIRVAPHVYNTSLHLQRLADCLLQV